MDKSAVYRSAFAIGVVLFAASSGLGLAYEVATQGRLPPLLPSPFSYATSLFARGEIDEAVSEYRTGTAISPHVGWSHIQLGFALSRSGDDAGALEAFRRAARLDPASGTAHYNIAVLSLRSGDLKTARRHARHAQRLAREVGESVDARLLDALGIRGDGS